MRNIGIALIGIGLFLVVKFAMIFLIMGLGMVFEKLGLEPISLATLSALSTVFSSIILLLIFYYWRPLSDLIDRWRLLSFEYVATGLLLGWTVLALNSFMLSTLIDNQADSFNKSLELLDGGIFGLFGIVILVPIIEEVVFRRVLIGSLSRNIHPYVAILISSVVFGLLHGRVPEILGATVMGFVFGWLYYKSKSILPSILLHVFNNGFFMFSLYQYKQKGPSMLEVRYWSFTFDNPYGIYVFLGLTLLLGYLMWVFNKKSKALDELERNESFPS